MALSLANLQAPKPLILLMGCGARKERRVLVPGAPENPTFDHAYVTTLDSNITHKPDVLWNLDERPLPFADNSFDEIHAYEVLEHIGRQGDWRGFFEEFAEYHRILKPDGLLVATTPSYMSAWCWGDPGHRRVFTPGTLVFLSHEEYEKQLGKSPMSDYREYLGKTDFVRVAAQQDEDYFVFILRAKKA